MLGEFFRLLYHQEYIIERRESILLHYSTMYHPFRNVSDLSSVIHNLGFHSLLLVKQGQKVKSPRLSLRTMQIYTVRKVHPTQWTYNLKVHGQDAKLSPGLGDLLAPVLIHDELCCLARRIDD